MPPVEIVRATWRDARALARLDQQCFAVVDHYDVLMYLSLLIWPKVIALKAAAGGQLVGFVAADPRRRHGHAVVVTLGVAPDWRRSGVGQRLMREVEARVNLPRIRLQVRRSNAAAIGLYHKLGYSVLGTLPHYYGDGEDAFLMEKTRD